MNRFTVEHAKPNLAGRVAVGSAEKGRIMARDLAAGLTGEAAADEEDSLMLCGL